MAIRLFDAVASASVTKTSTSVRVNKGTFKHTVDCVFNSTDDTEISACVIKLQGSETNEDAVNGVVTECGLVVGSTAEKVANVEFDYRINNVHYTKAADAVGVAISGFTVAAASKYGGFIVQINAAGTVTVKAPIVTMAYASMALANTAVDAVTPDVGQIKIGKVLMQNDAGAIWTAGTDDLTTTDLENDAAFISIGSSFTDLATITFSATELANARAVATVDNSPTGYIRLYLSTLTGTGEVTARYTPLEVY